jgi:hypothetical protein
MTPRFLVPLFLAVPLVFSIAPAFAQMFQPIFAKQYTRQSGTPVTTPDTFETCDPAGTFRMVVLNGASGQGQIGTDPISSGSISVNGSEIIHENDFGQNVTRIERPLLGLAASNRIDVRLRSGPSAAVLVTVEALQRCVGIRITSPVPDSTVVGVPVLVRGEVRTPPGSDLGVTVNGQPGFLTGDAFAAVIALGGGSQTITAKLNDPSGTIAQDAIAVQVAEVSPASALFFTASPTFGVAPLDVDLQATFLGAASGYQWDVDNNGTTDFSGAGLTTVTAHYATPGLYFPTVTVIGKQGAPTTVRLAVLVRSEADLIVLLEGKWKALKDALRAGDISRALGFVARSRRTQYQEVFQNLTVPLAGIDQVMTDIRFVKTAGPTAEFEMLRAEDGLVLSYLVRFIIDEDGLWRLRDM